MKGISIVFSYRVNIGSVMAEKIDYILITFITCIMNWAPIVKALPINLYWIITLTFLKHYSSFIILAAFAILSKLLIIFVDINPKIFPIKLKIFDF